MRTPLCELLGIEHPVIQAAIGGISCPALASAVSNAGGLGSIAMTGWGADGVRERLHEAHSTTKVFSAVADDTYYSTLFDGGWPGAPGRVIKNETIENWLAAGQPETGRRPGEDDVIVRDAEGHPIKRYAA